MKLLDKILGYFRKPKASSVKARRRVAKHKIHIYLTPNQIGAVKILIAEGVPTKDIAGAFSISKATISRIRTGKHPLV